ncbi:staphylococcal nuclease domain-containing protein 1 [Eurytemora carolleeae]|uniref:staphylococcal nuclease domain-containing protein 1 n=1 Tax=Eurytemora carolleeae TaxID=1294199 RepID=UPI000C760028|nr:staphylococcal nuclease domain-containing protein 1 [Eurytemora carolleeae]|eukprot:XP_023328486.1 staphylococcal nuclease domain-containing protein 1-like [Eurytemora affinis]
MAQQEQTVPATKQYFKGVVKSVLDGGAVVIRGQPRNGPPPERVLALTNIDAPRLGRRPTANAAATADEPLAWEAREFLRNLVVGKQVIGHVVHTANREYGSLVLGDNPETGVDVALALVDEGLAKCRDNCQDANLLEAQERAKGSKKGVWADDASSHVRNITWEVENPRLLVEKYNGKPVKAVVEHVRDGTTVRVLLVPDFIQITLMLSGVRSPGTKSGPDGKPDPVQSELYAVEAHYFTESRLLQRDVEVILESSSNNNFVGSVVHPMGNIAEALLKEGLAKCVDWSISKVTGGPEKYRNAEKIAKEKQSRLWRNYTATQSTISEKDREFTGKVLEIVNGDALMVKVGKVVRKIHLASIRPPRLEDNKEDGSRTKQKGFRPLYDIPFMYEAREFLRKKLIGHNVQVTVDYVQGSRPAVGGEPDYPEKTCCTVVIGNICLKSFSKIQNLKIYEIKIYVDFLMPMIDSVSRYDELLQAEDKAQKTLKGLHDKKNVPKHKVNDMTAYIQGVVEFVASGSRFRVFIPRETCILTFLLGGINCVRSSRSMPSGEVVKGDAYGDECLLHVKEMVMQREVEIEVESMDKAGNFIGYMWVDNNNMSVHLVQEGFASMHFTADKAQYGNMIKNAEDNAKKALKRIWTNYTGEAEPSVWRNTEVVREEEEAKTLNEDRKVSYEKVLVSEVTDEAKIYACNVNDGPALEKLMDCLREEFTANPPLAGAYQPRKNDLCAAKFTDNQWYRAKVEKVSPTSVNVLYIDYGNRAEVPKTKVASLPSSFTTPGGFAKGYNLALCSLPGDEELAGLGIQGLKEDLLDQTVKMNVEYRVGTDSFVTFHTEAGEDIGKGLVGDGLLLVDRKGGRKLAALVKEYEDAMARAKKDHLNIWRYGDITADDAKEFGTGK